MKNVLRKYVCIPNLIYLFKLNTSVKNFAETIECLILYLHMSAKINSKELQSLVFSLKPQIFKTIIINLAICKFQVNM